MVARNRSGSRQRAESTKVRVQGHVVSDRPFKVLTRHGMKHVGENRFSSSVNRGMQSKHAGLYAHRLSANKDRYYASVRGNHPQPRMIKREAHRNDIQASRNRK